MPSLIFLVLLFSFALQASSQAGPSNWTASPFNPPALPLAVRSPYFNVWLAQGNDPPTPFAVATNPWAMYTSTGWYASVVVDDKEYRLLGQYFNGEGSPDQTAVEFTATRTSFLMSAGGVQFNMTFLSPIEPKDLLRQSLPFAYLYMSAESTDGQQHRVRMYSDIEGNIIAGDASQIEQWTSEDSTDYVVLTMSLQNRVPFVENNIHPQDATVYYSFKKIEGATTSWSIANIDQTRGVFVGNPSGGNLNNQADPDSTFRPVSSGSNSSVLGMAIDWGNITSTPEPAVWALGIIRNPSVQYLTPGGVFEDRVPYFASIYTDPINATKFVLDDFQRALSAAEALDAQIRTDGETISSEYADLLALSARQAMGAMDVTIPPASSGNWDTSDVKIFMKNLGSVGSDNETIASVNNVDALYAAFPVFLYLDPDIGGYLLAPLLEFQDSTAYKLPYAAKNIGSAYPSAIANNISDPHIYGVDETANMIIMTLAYSQASGNGTLLGRHYTLLRSWAEYLGNNTITPFNQSSGDFSANLDFVSANQTNLALKGIIGIAAMAKIAEVAGVVEDQERFQDTATSAIQFWQDQALSSSHVNFFYGVSDSSGLMYNLYADKLLRLELVPGSVYTLLTEYYENTAGQTKYGIPLDNSPTQNTTTNWMMFAASTTTDTATRDLLISQIHAYASNNLNNVPFTSIYDPSTGLGGPGTSAGIASPAQGGMFALLALNTTSKPIAIPSGGSTVPVSSRNSSESSKTNAGIIAGAIVAGVIVVCCAAFGIFFIRRRRRLRETHQNAADMLASPHGAQPDTYSPQTTEPYSYTGLTSDSALESQYPSNSGLSQSEDLSQSTIQQRMGDRRRDTKREQAMMDANSPQMASLMNLASGSDSRDERLGRNGTSRTHGVEALRSEVDTLRRDMERMRQERLALEEAPPLYSDPI